MNYMQNFFLFLLLVVFLAPAANAVDIEIIKSGAGKVTFSMQNPTPGNESGRIFSETLREDLIRSGWFQPGGNDAALLIEGGVDGSGNALSADVNVRHTQSGKVYLAKRFRGAMSQPRRLAHEAADAIVAAVKGVRGIATSRIAMVGNIDGRKDIYMCDYDGRNLVRLTNRGAVCLSPAWFPDGQGLLYTSFHAGFPDVYMLDLAKNEQRRIAAFPGINAGASVAPDGRNIALALSKDGSPDIYILDLRKNKVRRITANRFAAAASPAWSPDGKHLVFVSDRTGRPQVYVRNLGSGDEQRISFQGNENVAPDWGVNGLIAYSSRRNGKYQICVWSPDGSTRQITADHADYEDVSWAPDGRHLVCTRTVNFESELYLLDLMGDDPVRLTTWKGDWYSPAWSR